MPAWLDWSAAVAWRALVVGVTVYAGVRVLLVLPLVVLPVILALFLTALLAPMASWLRDHGWPSLAATWLVLVGAVAALVGVGYGLAATVGGQLQDLVGQVGASLSQIRDWLVNGPLGLSEEQLGELLDQLEETVRARGGQLTERVLDWTTVILEVVAGALLTVVLTFFFIKDGPRLADGLLSRVQEPLAGRLRAAGQRAGATMTAYLRGVAIVGLFDAVLIGTALVLLRVPLALTLAALTFLAAFFPLVGAFTAGLLSALVALVANGPVTAALVVGVTIAVQQIEGNVLQPLVMSRAVRLHPVVVMVALTAGGVLWGVAGAFLAVPAVAVAVSASAGWRAVTAGDDGG